VSRKPAVTTGCGSPSHSTEFVMKKTAITLPKDLARWLRTKAARDDHSVSRRLAELLQRTRRQDDQYAAAMRRYLSMKPRKIDWPNDRRPTREELYNRPGLC
jgi:plasmid stability protein